MSSYANTSPMLANLLSKMHNKLDDDCFTSIRCNGRNIHIEMSPSYFHNSPITESRYRRFLAAIRDDYEGEQDPGEIEDEFHTWLIKTFGPLFRTLAPDLPPSFDPEKLRSGEAKPWLSEYLFPPAMRCRLEASNDTPVTLHLDNEGGCRPPCREIRKDLLDELGQYLKSFDPSTVEVSFANPEHALAKMPTRVLMDLDDSGEKSPCFFKFFPAGCESLLEMELEAYLRILRSIIDPDIHVIRLLGLVRVGDGEAVGPLLTYVDHTGNGGGVLEFSLFNKPLSLKEQWAKQIRHTISELYKGGIVWGDAKPGNVMINKNMEAWLIDCGGGYTEVWVDKEIAGTKEGDLQGVERIVEFMFDEEWLLDDLDTESISEDDRT